MSRYDKFERHLSRRIKLAQDWSYLVEQFITCVESVLETVSLASPYGWRTCLEAVLRPLVYLDRGRDLILGEGGWGKVEGRRRS